MRAKDYAVSIGLATAGRGRMSREAHAAIKDAIENKGMSFDDYFVKGSKPAKTVSVEKPAKVKAESVASDNAEGENVYAQAFMRYPLDQMFKGTDSKGREHKVNARQICKPCGYSLCGHGCNDPEVLVGFGEWVKVTPIGE